MQLLIVVCWLGAQSLIKGSPSDGELGTASKPPKSKMSFPKKVLSKSNTCRWEVGRQQAIKAQIRADHAMYDDSS